ncbi:2-succinyl-5-enolpyruvyl-6-hydroxy-3-cyclohexene-1-carboxylic-acid synthase [Fischerella thermalis CCMEE 5330]|uniref:2-succinyl-5-enolpyruvyl-6-hydroxy-3-cyclohexene-1-carboxylate synthase n=1 Tax=Fischerella thermalis CCMEE 5330 TaxID=2019670 RepID=A0A2N6M0A4_9CYAN|nr:2-succinyl-5-enolpyruvyl-6-hydroxy-3-cyclohexene-1-carboxylic-acid synthase [Fischerella thermalis]PMB40211.1 2-succinyl-5-enolpyruvyl-6-hydroxy-3-cyclohexene-1-carboxylic-acid synthase [Fischerella thermalis CCMEE 5330]
MQVGFRNTNELWASVLTQTLQHLGLTTAIICPGSRSTPLAVAFAQQAPEIDVISILDERSAAFFALGRAKATGLPPAIVCTSGTAGANFYPAVIEAKQTRVPLLVLTADRPPELRDCHSGQTIDQLKLYGSYPNWQTELALPVAEMGMLAYLRQTMVYAWERSLYPVPGPIHLNIPFRDPLAPIPEANVETQNLAFLQSQFNPEEFFAHVTKFSPSHHLPITPSVPLNDWQNSERGIIIAGVAQPQQPQEYCQAIAQLAQTLQFPVLAEGLSPVRNYASINPHIISTYDLILRNQQLAKQLTPEIVIQIGEMPTSPVLRNWLKSTAARRWVIDSSDQNLDPLHSRTVHLRVNVEELVSKQEGKFSLSPHHSTTPSSYLQLWHQVEVQVRTNVDHTFKQIDDLLESKIAWLLSQSLPPQTPLFIANSMPVRDVEYFWQLNQSGIRPFFNRGANGIDGTLSTALGIAHRHQSSVMLTGDLALLHDTNGFLIRNKFVGHLTIVLVNNNGGGIFEMLPIAKFEPPFEEFFATPQNIDFSQLCASYSVEHELITSWEQLQTKLNPLPTSGIRVLELRTNRKLDAQWRQENLGKFAKF